MLAQLIEELQALLASVEAEERELTEDEAKRASDLNDKIEAAKTRKDIQTRSESFLKVNPPVSFATPKASKDTYERAFDHYLRTGQTNSDLVMYRAQETGTPSEGGYLVPDGFRDKLVEVRKAFGGLAAEADVFSTSSGNPLEYPTLNDTANVGGITAEEAAFVDGADLVFGTVTLGAYKFTSTGVGTTTPLRVSVELLQDAAFDVQGLVARKLGERIARKEADMWINGTGSGMPQGLFQPTKDQDVDVADVVDYDDLSDFEASLDPAYEANAKWIMSKGTWSVIKKLVGTDGRPLVQEAGAAGIGTMPTKSLLGYPVVIDQACATFGAATGPSTNIGFGDFREGYAIRRVSDLVVVVNPWTRANFGQVEFIAYSRADGVVQNKAAYKLLANL